MSKVKQYDEDMTYRVYITDGLHSIVGTYIGRYYDIINGKLPEPKKEETADEIVSRIVKEGGLKFKE